MAMTNTALQTIRAMYPSLLDRHELRGARYTLLNRGVANANNPSTGIISPDVIQKSRELWGRGQDIPVMSPAAAANGTGLACTFTGTEAISDLVSVNYVSVSNGFEMQPQKNAQNEISYLQEYARKYTDAIRAMATAVNTAVDTTLTAALKTAYTSSFVGVGTKYGALAANKIQVALANRPDFFNELVDINADEDIYPMFDVFLSTNGRSIVRQLFAQGEANDTNTQYQFTMGDYNFYYDNAVTLGAASDASGYFMPVGSFGIIGRNSPDCLAGRGTSDGKQFGTVFDPTMGMTLDTLSWSTCGAINTESGNADDTAAVREYHTMAAHYAILTPFTSVATDVIGGFDLLTA